MISVLRSARVGEVGVYGALTLLGLGAAVAGSRYGLVVEGGRVGPGLLPAVSGGLLVLLGVVLTVRAWRERARGEAAEVSPDVEDTDMSGRTPAQRVRHLWIVFGLLLLAILAVAYAGFLLSFGALVLVVSVWLERRGVLGSLLITGCACGLMYLVFEVFLRVPLPGGLLGT